MDLLLELLDRVSTFPLQSDLPLDVNKPAPIPETKQRCTTVKESYMDKLTHAF